MKTLFLTLVGILMFTCAFAADTLKIGSGFTPAKMKRIDAAGLEKKIRQKEEKKYSFVLIDTRNEFDHRKGSIPGAVNLPFKKHRFLVEKIASKNDDIVCYGYSKKNPSDVNAIIWLMNNGYNRVWFFEEGFAGWPGAMETSKRVR